MIQSVEVGPEPGGFAINETSARFGVTGELRVFPGPTVTTKAGFFVGNENG